MSETKVIEAITEQWGPRCPDFEPACACCQAWAEYDHLCAYAALLAEPRLTMRLAGGRVLSQGRPDQTSFTDWFGEAWKAATARIIFPADAKNTPKSLTDQDNSPATNIPMEK